MARWTYILRRLLGKLWLRAALLSLGGVVLALLGAVLSPAIEQEIGVELGQDAVGSILSIMASSMLAVTTFSLTAMVSAYSSATQLGTPRATQLMLEDSTSQNALSTFVGAFVFAIVGIIALSTEVYGGDGRIILFAGTVLVVLLVVVTLLRWIGHITAFGRMADVIDRVETAACRAMRRFADDPWGGGRAAIAAPADSVPVTAPELGYVTHVDVAALGRVARDGRVLHVEVAAGQLVHPARALVRVVGPIDEQSTEAIRNAFTIERHRAFDHDPRLGLVALAEIGGRALSPAVNDPGTAIEVLNAQLRVLSRLPADRDAPEDDDDRPAVHVHRPTQHEMLRDAFHPILRDGAGQAEVTIRLTKALATLADLQPHMRTALRDTAIHLCERVDAKQDDPREVAAFHRVHDRLWAGRGSQ